MVALPYPYEIADLLGLMVTIKEARIESAIKLTSIERGGEKKGEKKYVCRLYSSSKVRIHKSR
jgi:hypothetical protein